MLLAEEYPKAVEVVMNQVAAPKMVEIPQKAVKIDKNGRKIGR
jgi:hypothetical protein